MAELVFRDDAYARSCRARVVAVRPAGIELDRTVFYPTGGGQPGDTGELRRADGTVVRVAGTVKGEGADAVLHLPWPGAPALQAGEEVEAVLDWERRYCHMRFHTALHLLCAVVPAPVTQARPPSSLVLDFRDADVTELAASPVEEMIGVSSSANENLIFNFNFRLYVQPAGTVTAIAFTADDSRFITGTADGIVETWDITSGDQLSTQDTGNSILSLAAGPAGLALGTMDKILLTDINTGQEITELPSP